MGPVGPRVLWAHFLLLANFFFGVCEEFSHCFPPEKYDFDTYKGFLWGKKNDLNLLDFDNFKFV